MAAAGLLIFSSTKLGAQKVGDAGVVEVDRFAPPACTRAVHAFARGVISASDLPVLCPIPATDEAVLLDGALEVPAPATPVWGIRIGTHVEGSNAHLGAGTSEWVEGTGWVYPGPESLALPGSGLALDAWARKGRVAARVRGVSRSTRPFEGSHGSAKVGPIRLWAGSRPVAFSWGRWGGAVLNQGKVPTLVGFETVGGFRLPWVLRALGPANLFAFVGPGSPSGSVRNPLFAGARIQFAPASWLVLGANRALLFGGEGNQESLTAGNVALALLGFTSQFGKNSDFENQVASLDALARVRLAGRPAAVYGEWAADDSGLALIVSPAFRIGAELYGAAGRWWGGEGAFFGKARGERPPWYRHGALGGGWSSRGTLLGHPLGGHGAQVVVGSGVENRNGGWESWFGLRKRGSGNLYAPDREGGGVFGGVRVRRQMTPWAGLRMEGEGEWGEGWRSGVFSLEAWIQPGG